MTRIYVSLFIVFVLGLCFGHLLGKVPDWVFVIFGSLISTPVIYFLGKRMLK